ncbi:MAG: Smr protein [Oscillospiraceae bacterium]|nr:Smr protein [Oscillospiraceae bacterium]
MAGSLREINLEEGRPTADRAIRRLTFELSRSVTLGTAVVKIIHGYGSSGAGGRIRIEARDYLSRLKTRGDIQDFIPGEEFSIFSESTRHAFAVCDSLRKDRDLERHNNGVTFIVL